MPSTAASNWHCSTPITTSTAFSPSTSSTRRPPSRCCRCCVRASGHPVTRRRGSCATSSGRIRRHWPRVEIAVRGDGHYGTPEVMDLLEDQGHGYILGLPGNARLSEIGQPWCEDAALRRVQSGKDKVRRFFQTGYQAKSWSRERKVVAPRRGHRKGDGCPLRRHQPAGPRQIALREGLLRPWPDGKHDQGAQALPPNPTAPRVTDGKPTSSGCSCTPPPIGCCISCAGPRPAARRGAPRRSRRYDGHSSRSPCASRSSTPASRSPCPRPTHIATPLIAMAASIAAQGP